MQKLKALNNVLLIFIMFRHIYELLYYCTVGKKNYHNAEKAFSVTMFRFEIKIMDKCCAGGKQPQISSGLGVKG